MSPVETADHHGSHRELLWTPDSSAWARVDAIVVPTVRQPAYLETAMDLAGQLGCPLVTLHSGKWTSAAEAMSRVPPGVNVIAIDMPDLASLRLMDFETTRLLAGTRFERRTDTSAKRNVGLLLAHAIGWQRVVFLDDDIKVPDPSDLNRAAGLLDTYNAVGLSIGGFPDNSVVCHAYRKVGGDQHSFIGGGALAVAITRSLSFFPDIYNEDWFYMLDPGKGLQPLAVIGKVIQSRYDPFRDEERARREEFGDVLAEGIFWILDRGGSLDDADVRHWREFLRRRRRFIEHILYRLDRAQVEPGERARMEAALRASLGRLARIEPDWCQMYLRAWMADRAGWEQHVGGLRRNLSVQGAIRSLSKKGRRPVSYQIRDASAVAAGVP